MNNIVDLQINLGIYFDVSKNIGMGHFYRCLNFSNIVNFKYTYFYYIDSDDNIINNNLLKLTNKNNLYLIKIINKEELTSITSKIKFNLFVIDSFDDNLKLENKIKPNVSKLLIWDHYPYKKHNCHFILDHTINKLEDCHYNNINKDCTIIYGTDKVILNSNFYKTNIDIKTSLISILIMMGGTDINNDTLVILNSLLNIDKTIFDSLKFKVIVTDSYQEKEKIINFCKKYQNIQVILNIDNNDIPKLLNTIDLLINTAGMSNFEALFFGIPSLTIFTKDFHYDHFRSLIVENIVYVINKENKLYKIDEIINDIKDNYNNIYQKLINVIPKNNKLKMIISDLLYNDLKY
jgi:spore coat polysaccharide biosynthesis predicted glycosyltransferase SpsG